MNVTTQNETPRRVVILADESAAWMIAGLRQLDRLALSLNSHLRTASQHARATVCVFWKPEIPSAERWMPRDRRISRLNLTADSDAFFRHSSDTDLVLTTRLFLHRDALAHFPFLKIAAPGEPDQKANETWQSYLDSVEETYDDFPANDAHPWEYVPDRGAIADCERRFLRRNGKSQDGWVSRHLNRPVSQWVTRLLLKIPLMPTVWTWSILLLPIVGALIFLQGDYTSFVLGAAFYQLYSMLDGCDGEIARAKFLETERGRRLDTWCDLFATLLMVVTLGYGLSSQTMHSKDPASLYLLEGVVVAILISINELLLAVSKSNHRETRSSAIITALYPRHHHLATRSGLLFFGEKFAWRLIQLTKRDVALFVFLLLALIGLPAWILHLLGMVAIVSLFLAGQALVDARRRSRHH